MSTAIKHYWNTRAADHGHCRTATTNDIHLRELEARTLERMIDTLGLKSGARVLDAGCGDGATTLRLAATFPTLHFTGVDYAPAMIAAAQHRLRDRDDADELTSRVLFAIGDVLQLDREGLGSFELGLTCRCLINLDNEGSQRAALAQIASCLRSGATLLAIENFHEGQEELNRAREAAGLPPIPIRWHNRYFTEDAFCAAARGHFIVKRFIDFASAYYFATRVIYSKMCQMRSEEPDYDHDLHRLAVDLPAFGCFSPVRLAVLVRM